MPSATSQDSFVQSQNQGGLAADLIEEHDRVAAERRGGVPPGVRRSLPIAAGAAVLILASIAFITWQISTSFDTPGAGTRIRVAIDSETGEVFERYRIKDGQSQPWPHPRTGALSLYPAEACHWTAEGKAKIVPTFVLLNEHLGRSEPTTCPDCGRRVVPHNPLPPLELMDQALAAADR